jgi:hypothetical protein
MRGPAWKEPRTDRRDTLGSAELHRHTQPSALTETDQQWQNNRDKRGTGNGCIDRLPNRQSKGRFGTKSPITYADSYETLRYAFQNINGFHHKDTASKVRNGEGFKIHRSVGATVLGLAETNTEWNHNDGQGMKSIRKQVVGAYAHASCSFSTSRLKHTALYKPGGTMTAVCNPWNGHVVDQGSDNKLGNYSYCTLKGKGDTRLTFITAYRVGDIKLKNPVLNALDGSKDSMRAYTQQRQVLREEGKLELKPRDVCLAELAALIKKKFNSKGHEIILGIDANESITNTGPKSIRAIVSDLGLHDALEYANPGQTRAPTMDNGSEVIDGIYCTAGVLQFIKQAGEFEMNEGFQSDHPALFLDIDATGLLSNDFSAVFNSPGRRLQLQDKDSVTKYIKELTAQFGHNQIEKRCAALSKVPATEWTPSHTTKYNNLDGHITSCMLRAELVCRKLGRGDGYLWSPDLHLAGSQLSYWHLLLESFSKLRNIPETTLTRQREMAKISEHPVMKKQAVMAEFKSAKKVLADVQKHHVQLRRNHLERLAAGIDEDKNRDPNKTNTVRHLIKAEEQRLMFRRCQQHLGKTRNGLSEILVPSNPQETASNTVTEWRRESNKDNVTTALLNHNDKHFQQAWYTPFATGSLAELVGFDGTSDNATKIISGDFEVSDSMPEIMQFIKTFKKPKGVQPMIQIVTPEKFVTAFSKIHEKKASSASGRHIGHYKAATKSTLLTKVLSTMMNIPWQVGVIPERWTRVIDVILGKEDGIPRLHRTRIVQLIEADLNQALLLVFTQPMTRQMNKFDGFHESQTAQAQQQCTSAVAHKILTCEYSRIMHHCLGWMENDATGCFDRIIPNTALINSRKMGASIAACKALGTVWKNLKHQLKIGKGISERYYPTDPKTFHAGAGQGSCFAALCWSAVTTQIYSVLEKMDQVTLQHPITLHTTKSNAKGYVDDTSLMVNYNGEESIEQNSQRMGQELASSIQALGQKAERLLFVSGGALQHPKCHWYVMTWKWDSQGRAFLNSIVETPADMHLTSGRGTEEIKIERKETSEACKSLGCYPAPDGNQKKQYDILLKKAMAFGTAARHRGTTKMDAYMKHNVFFMPAMTFPLGVADIEHKDLQVIQQKFLKPTKQQMGFRSTVSNALMFAPRYYLGVGLPSMPVISDMLHLRMLCGHLRENKKIGKTMLTTLGAIQIQSGLVTPVFQSPKKYNQWCEKGWTRKCWEILQDHEIDLQCEEFLCPSLLRVRDKSIMKTLMDSGKFERWQMRDINRCRLYLKAVTISDIASACGKKMNSCRWKKNQEVPVENSPYVWPLQAYPGARSWRTWRLAIRSCLTGKSKDKSLLIPLGEWTSKPRQHFEWYLRPNKQSLIHVPLAGSARQHISKKPHHNSKGGLKEFHGRSRDYESEMTLTGTSDLLLADVAQRKSGTLLLESSMTQFIKMDPPCHSPPSTVGEYIHRLPPFFHALFPPLDKFDKMFTEHAALVTSWGTIQATSTSKIDTNTNSLHLDWKLYYEDTKTHKCLAEFHDLFPSGPNELKVKRGIQLNLLAITILIQALDFIGIHIDLVHLDKETQAVLEWTTYQAPRQGFNSLAKPNSDVGRELQGWISRTTCQFDNADTDLGCTDHTEETENEAPQPLSRHDATSNTNTNLPHPPAAIYWMTIDGKKYNYLPEEILKERATLPKFKTFLAKHCEIPEEMFENVAWPLSAKALDTNCVSRMLPIVKFISNEWSTGDKMQAYFKESCDCPFCGSPETMKHVYSCNHSETVQCRNAAVATMAKRIKKIDPDNGPAWCNLTITAIKELGGEIKIPDNHEYQPPSDTLHKAQTDLGWMNLLQGRIHKDIWTTLQEGKGISSGAHAINALWKMAATLWRRRNRKKHGETSKERRKIIKDKLDETIATLRSTLCNFKIPHQDVPRGYRFRIDAKKNWIRWETTTLKMWHKGELAYQNSIAPQVTNIKTSNTGEMTSSDRSTRKDRNKKITQALHDGTGSAEERPRQEQKKSKKPIKPCEVATNVAHHTQAKKKNLSNPSPPVTLAPSGTPSDEPASFPRSM